MQITTEMAEEAKQEAASNAPDFPDRIPMSYLPNGNSIMRFYMEEGADGKLLWLRDMEVFQYQGVGSFDSSDSFCQELLRRAKAADEVLPPEKRWSWRWKARRMGVMKANFYTLDAEHANLKYISVDSPRIVVMGSRAINAFQDFMAGLTPHQVMENLDPDKPGRAIRVTHVGGPQGRTSVGWDFDDKELPPPKTDSGIDLPALSQCWVQAGATPSATQRQVLENELRLKISQTAAALEATTLSPSGE